jgi:hypothetical protein
MTAATHARLLNRLSTGTVYLNFRGMNFPVKVTDIRQVYTRVDALVTPIGGAGAQWFYVHSLSLDFDINDYLTDQTLTRPQGAAWRQSER